MDLSFASPSWLWMGLIAIPIIACYLLRVQPRRYDVSTLMFWDHVIQDTKRRAWWQSLRRWLSLLLQLVFAGLLIAAMLDPIFGRSEKSRDVVLVIDRSASMNATMEASDSTGANGGQTRLDAALERAKSLANGLRGGDTMAVIAAGGTVEVVAGRGDFAPAIVDAIDSVRPSDGPGQLEDAIELARRIAPEEQRRQIIVLTDKASPVAADESTATETAGGQGDAPQGKNGDNTEATEDSGETTENDEASSGESDLFFETQGESQDNWAITAMAVRRSLADPIGFSTRITVQRFADEPLPDTEESQLRLNIRLIPFEDLDRAATEVSDEPIADFEGQLVDVLPIKLDDDNRFTWTTEATSAAGGVLVAELDFGDEVSVSDAIASDNSARAIVPPRPDVPVQIIAGDPVAASESGDDSSDSSGDSAADDEDSAADAGLFFLRNVLQSIPTLKVLEEGEELPPGGLTVWYRLRKLPSDLPDGPLLVLSPQVNGPALGESAAPAWTLGESIETPIVAKTSESSPLMRHVQMTNVSLGVSRSVEVADGLGIVEPLIQTAADDTVAVAIERTGDAAGSRILVLSTELGASDFPLRIAFPVMMTNAVNWFTGRDAECPSAVIAGVPSEAKVAGQAGLRLSGDRVLVSEFRGRKLENTSVVPLRDDLVALQALTHVGLARVTPSDGITGDSSASIVALDASDGDNANESTEAASPVTKAAELGGWIAVNLCDPSESDTRIAESSEADTKVSFASGSSPWFYLVMVALALIVTEWGLFQRRIVE